MVFPNFALKTRVACDMSPTPQRATSVLIGSFDERRVRAASWVLKRVVHNKEGLHNRVTYRIPLLPFSLKECEAYADSLDYLMPMLKR